MAAVLAGLAATGGCQYVKAPWSARTGAPAAAGDTLGPDTARADTPVRDTATTEPPTRDTAGTGPAADTADGPLAGEARPGRGDSARTDSVRPDSARRDTLLPERYPSAGELEEMGPTYTEYAIGPSLLPGEWLTGLLRSTLAPVIDRHDALSVKTFALFWVLVDTEGDVRDAVLHTSSRSQAFDRAARAVAERLRYRPAIADGRPVPVWVLARISLLMR